MQVQFCVARHWSGRTIVRFKPRRLRWRFPAGSELPIVCRWFAAEPVAPEAGGLFASARGSKLLGVRVFLGGHDPESHFKAHRDSEMAVISDHRARKGFANLGIAAGLMGFATASHL